ncbi:MAG: glycoside hydrolase family 3 N-terminal domain-containing protein [Vicinamibacteraceae bacterium]
MPFERAAIVFLVGLIAAPLVGVPGTPRVGAQAQAPAQTQPGMGVRSRAVLPVDGLRFKDANGSGALEPYEDWRRPVEARVRDLVGRMTLEEKAGLMLIDTLNAGCGGALTPTATAFVETQKMTRFILRNVVKADGDPCDAGGPAAFRGVAVSPRQMAEFTNAVQALAEGQRLGIPVVFKDNARNHYETDPRFGISAGAGAFTEFPKEAGIAAAVLGTGSIAPVTALTEVMGAEWRAIGLRGMYGYTADLATEPRWYRVHETFTEDADLDARIIRALVTGLQGGPVSPSTSVALTIKHFPGGGPQEMGLDPHYSFGKRQVYPGGRFADHLKPFIAAIDAGVSSVMPYYGVPVQVTHHGVRFEETGFAFSPRIVNDLLRTRLHFTGYVNSDTGIVTDRAWGLEQRTVPERVAAAINGGTDVLSGFSTSATITDLVKAGLVAPARVDEAVSRLLAEQFRLGLFEDPYVDATKAPEVIGSAAHRARGLEVQRQSIVLLQNQTDRGRAALPLAAGAKVYTIGMGKADVDRYGFVVTDGNSAGGQARPSAAGHDAAIIRVQVRNANTNAYRSMDPTSGADPARLNPRTRLPWGAEDPCVLFPAVNTVCSDDGRLGGGRAMGLFFGGALPWEANNLSFTTMAASQSWQITPSLADIQAVMREVGPRRTVLAIYFRNPYVLDDASGLKDAGAIVASFGVSDVALLDVLSGRFKPTGKLPFALARTLQAIVDNQPDVPGYPAMDTLYPFGFGASY